MRPNFKMHAVFFILVLVIILFENAVWAKIILAAESANSTGFRAAAVKVDITPEDSQYLLGFGARQSQGVHNRIYHRIVVLDDGAMQFVLASTEICIISPHEYDRIAERVNSRYKINPLNLWWATTHTHSAPEVGESGLDRIFLGERYQHKVDADYTALVERKLLDGIEQALQNLVPARLGLGWGYSQANINRRAIDIDGKASLGMNPDGIVDRRIGLLRIEKLDGTPLALIANYPLHGTVLGQDNLKISGDAPGIVAEYVEQKIGAPLIYINGAAGNLAPIYSCYSSPQAGHLGQFRVLLGDKILDANQKISATNGEVTLKSESLIVETPRKSGLGWPENLKIYTRPIGPDGNMVRLPIRFLKINSELVIWSAPVELFCEIANEIRDRSPFLYTFYFGYTNGWLGYLLTAAEINHGGYEASVSPFTADAAKTLVNAVTSYVQGEMKNE